MYSITMYIVKCTVLQCTLYMVKRTMHNVHCTLYIVQCTVNNVHCTMYCILDHVPCTINCIQFTYVMTLIRG